MAAKDFKKPILNKDKKPLTILETAAHHCIRCVKKSRALRRLGYVTHGIGNRVSYGTDEYDTYAVWHNERQFKNLVKMYVDQGIDIIEWNNEPDHPVIWIRDVLKDMNVEDRVKIISDMHDLDSIRKKYIPLEERHMFNASDGIIYVSLPIEKITNDLHQLDKPYVTLYSYCNEGAVDVDWSKLDERRGLVYEGGANPPDDQALNQIFSYRSLYGIIKGLVDMGNEVHCIFGNITAFNTYQHTGAILYPPTVYDKMMEMLTKFKYGILIFNNEDGKKDQVNYTLTNKAQEYLQAGVPSLACWCPESEKWVKKHGIGLTFKHITEIGNVSQFERKYREVIDNIKKKRNELLMENFIWRLENTYADVLGLERKKIPEKIKQLSIEEYGKENTARLLLTK